MFIEGLLLTENTHEYTSTFQAFSLIYTLTKLEIFLFLVTHQVFARLKTYVKQIDNTFSNTLCFSNKIFPTYISKPASIFLKSEDSSLVSYLIFK